MPAAGQSNLISHFSKIPHKRKENIVILSKQRYEAVLILSEYFTDIGGIF